MAEQKNPQAQPELSLSEQTRIRREKLANLLTPWRASPSRWQAA